MGSIEVRSVTRAALAFVRPFLTVAVGCALAACAKAGIASERSGVLIVAIAQEPVSLNPLYLEGPLGYAIGELGYSYLTNYDSRGTIVADVATVVPTRANGGISTDGKRVTYHLRHDATWQDGVPLSSRDVAFTYRAIMNPANAVSSRYGYDRVASVDAPDPYTTIVTLKRPYSPIVSSFFGGDSNYPILPAHLLAAYPNLNHLAYNAAPLGSGPYRMAKWTHGDRLDILANNRYYAGPPAIRRVSLHFVHDSSTIVDQLTTKEVDATFFADVSRIDALRRIPNHRVVVTPVPYFYAMPFNVTDPVTKELAVRQAFALAIDRHTLVEKVTHGLYDSETGMRGLFTWAFDSRASAAAFDPRHARALLERAGWNVGPDGVRTKNGQRLELQLAFFSGSDIENEFVPLIVEQERAVGIDVETKRYSREEFTALDGPLMQGRFQVALYAYQSSLDPDASWLLACAQRGPHGFNDARYCNPAVDHALAHAASVFDRNARRRDYRFVQRQLLTDMPYDFLCQVSEIDVLPSALEGYDRPLLSPYNSVARWRYAWSR